MKTRITITVLFFMLFTAACANGQKTESTPIPDYTSYSGLSALMDSQEQGRDFFLIDVRTPSEYENGHIPSALLIPYDTISGNMPTEDKDALVILYCRSGNRAGVALNALKSLGYTNVHNFGGVSKWEGPLNEGTDP